MPHSQKIACIFNYAPHYRHCIYHLMAKEFQCDFYFGKNLPNGEKIKKMDVHTLPGFKKEYRVFKFRYIWQCGVVPQAFKSYRIYILTGSVTLSSIVLMFFARLLGKKVFLWAHGLKSLEGANHPLVRYFFRSATGYLLYGQHGKKMMQKYGIPESRLFVINNSLDYDRQLEVRKKLAVSDIFKSRFHNSDPVVIFTGRLQPNKKIDMIMDSQKALADACPFNLVLVGDGPERQRLMEKADQAQLSKRVWFYGECYDEATLGELYYNAALTVAPGNVGLTAVHSMMYGTPVVSHDNVVHQMPEYETIRPGQTGSLFRENDTADLSRKIKTWLDEHRDRDGVRQSCYEVIDQYYNPYYQIGVIEKAIYG